MQVRDLGMRAKRLIQGNCNLLNALSRVDLSEKFTRRRLAWLYEAKEAILITVEIAAPNPKWVVDVVDRHGPTPILGIRFATGQTASREFGADKVSELLTPAPRVDLLVFARQSRKGIRMEFQLGSH